MLDVFDFIIAASVAGIGGVIAMLILDGRKTFLPRAAAATAVEPLSFFSKENRPMSKFVPLEISDEALEALDAEHDDVMMFRGHRELAPWLCVVRRPNADEALAYKTMASDPAKKTSANAKLITSLSVYPKKDTEEWKRQYSRWPLFPDGLVANARFEAFCGLSDIIDAREK